MSEVSYYALFLTRSRLYPVQHSLSERPLNSRRLWSISCRVSLVRQIVDRFLTLASSASGVARINHLIKFRCPSGRPIVAVARHLGETRPSASPPTVIDSPLWQVSVSVTRLQGARFAQDFVSKESRCRHRFRCAVLDNSLTGTIIGDRLQQVSTSTETYPSSAPGSASENSVPAVFRGRLGNSAVTLHRHAHCPVALYHVSQGGDSAIATLHKETLPLSMSHRWHPRQRWIRSYVCPCLKVGQHLPRSAGGTVCRVVQRHRGDDDR